MTFLFMRKFTSQDSLKRYDKYASLVHKQDNVPKLWQ